MSERRYLPPGVAVADAAGPARGPSPWSLKVAVLLLVLGGVLGVTDVLPPWEMINDGSIAPITVLARLLPFALIGFLLYFVVRGRNWARIVVAVCVVVAFANYMNELATIGISGRAVQYLWYSRHATSVTMLMLPHLVNAAALLLLFWPARAWFRRAA